MSLDILTEFEALIAALAARRIDYAVCGGFAVNIHGHVRTTRDIDLLIRPEALDDARGLARELGFTLEAGPIPFASGTAQARELYRSSKVSGPRRDETARWSQAGPGGYREPRTGR